MSDLPSKDLSEARQEYALDELLESQAAAEPLSLFDTWFNQALAAQVAEPYAFSLASSSSLGRPSVRTVLMREYSAAGLTFYTNYRSHKGANLNSNPQCEALFFWPDMQRQVRLFGEVSKLSEDKNREYFAKRPKSSQLAALVSDPQSASVDSRDWMSERYQALEAKYAHTQVPKPEWWGGYLIEPLQIEFWQGRRSRMHDRLLYKRANAHSSSKWQRERLLP